MLCPNPRCERTIPDDAALCCYCGRKLLRTISKRTRPNGSGTAWKRGNVWQAEVVLGYAYDEEKGKSVKRRVTKSGFQTKKAALDYCQTLRAGAPSFTPKPEAKTVDYYWTIAKAQFETKKISKLSAYRYAYDKWEALHNRDVVSLTVKELQAIVDEKASTFYPAKDMKTVMSKVYALALADEVVTVDKSKSITLPLLEEEEAQPWTEDELKKQWDAFEKGHTFVGYILLMDYTGMMPGELMACEKKMIDFDKGQIVGAGKKTSTRKKAPIVFPAYIEPVLRALYDFSPSEKLLCMNKDNFYKKFKEVTSEIGCRDLPPYSCRHTTGTALALGGNIAPAIIQKVMRHSKYSSTQRYLHPSYDDVLAALNTIEKPNSEQ